VSDVPRDGSDQYWEIFTREAAALNAPLYVRLAQGVQNDTALRTLAGRARPGQPHANMLFGAVHFLLLRGLKHPLCDFYPNLAKNLGKGDPFPSFRDFCLIHHDEIVALLATRVTNTNEVGRSAFLHAGFAALAPEAPQPFHVIEIGPSAGLNLYWDRYGYRYVGDGETFICGAPGAGLVIETPLKGGHVPPLNPTPRIGMRIGLELHPVDLDHAGDRDWLKALVWPEHEARFRRLELALRVNEAWPHDIRAGDALELLPGAIAGIPERETLCVYHTLTVYQFPDEAKTAIDDLLTLTSLRRPLWRLSLERTDNQYPLTLTYYADGAKTARVLAFCGPQGSWFEWRG
jgi:hypothetical protein